MSALPAREFFGRWAELGRLLVHARDTGGVRVLAPPWGGASELLRLTFDQLFFDAGVVGDAELIEFRSEVETLATRIGASVAAPEMREALDAARTLDRRCADADIQVALHVIGEIDPAAAAAELERLSDAPYQAVERADGLTLIMDVPRVADVTRSYESMTRMAVHLAGALGGRVVDDRGNALDERALAAIGAELEPMRRLLAEVGIEPGSPLALRLFS